MMSHIPSNEHAYSIIYNPQTVVTSGKCLVQVLKLFVENIEHKTVELWYNVMTRVYFKLHRIYMYIVAFVQLLC